MAILTEISEESSSSSSSILTNYNYDVFISFRGEDTRNSFTDHLLKALRDATIDPFFDDTEIQIGDFLKPELDAAIKSSRASIIVLSENYATSTWCLDELALIMEQRMTSQHIVFPIFYKVKPSDVRKQRKSFGDAMADHKERLKTETNEEKKSQWDQKIQQWEKALTEVADLKGEEANGRRETILIQKIVKEISNRLDLHKRSEIPKLIGMESSVRTITWFLKDGSRQILTIWGMAGIGKTYLADYIFKSHYLEFESSCFLEDIERRCIPPNRVLDLQKQLLKDIRARSWLDINDVKAGTLMIEKLLFRKRTLLVLDGIDNFEQLDVLIGTKSLHSGSKIIITSKNGTLTEKCKLFELQVRPQHTKLLLEGLDDKESLQLLHWHAFGCNVPGKEDKKESMKVVKYCKGHPLALKVLGSSLRSEDATWDDILESLGNEINPGITKVLKVSFDTLPSEKDKELFKFIACLFVGEDRKFAEDILKACGVCKSSGIKVLINRCLLTIGSSEKLMMHQLLQDMGRDLVHQESPKKPWKRSILWRHEECLDVLQNRLGTAIIQGLVLDMRTFDNETLDSSSVNIPKIGFRSFQEVTMKLWWLFGWVSRICSTSLGAKCDFETLALSEMRNLRLLQLNYVQLSGSYTNFPRGLRWLCMHGFPLSYIPSDIPMENMVALDMSNSKLQQLWKKHKLLKSLKFLNLSNCYELVRVGDFSSLPLLERLMLTRCTSLVEVCESIGVYCQRLEVLDLSECSKLEKLPRSIGKLKKLTQLLIDGCSNLAEFPVEMKDMESLEYLQADNINKSSHGSSSYTMVPRSSKFFVSSLPRSLVTLSLRYCNLHNESFPMDVSSLSMLKELYLDGNPIDYMPNCVRSLSRLERLTFSGRRGVKTVLCAPILLKYLGLYKCDSFEKLTFHPEKSALPVVASFTLSEIQYRFKTEALSDIDEEVLRSLGWNNIKYLHHCFVSKTDDHGRILSVPAQILFEHGIFSTYLQGKEIPKQFTHRNDGSLFTLQSSPNKGNIQGLNLCIVRTISSLKEAGPSRVEIRNLTKSSSWTYQPIMYFIPQDDNFDCGDEVVVWLSHWMFGRNEFEDGDDVSIHFSVKYNVSDGEASNYGNVSEYGMSLMYDDYDDDDDDDDDDGDGDGDGENKKEDPLRYYKSWKHIIGGDLSTFEVSPSHYLLTP